MNTKERILRSFSELLENEPVDKITVKRISANCDLTSQTFYNHFEDKYDLILWSYRRRVDELYELYSVGEITWRELLERYLSGYKQNAKLILNIMKNTHGNDSYYVGSSGYLVKKFKEHFKKKLGVEELDPKTVMLINTFIGGMVNIIGYWLDKEKSIDEKEMAEILDLAFPEYLRHLYRNE